MSKMTLEEIQNTNKIMLTPEEACGVLGCTAQLLRIRARDPKLRLTLGFPIMAIGQRVKIPTKGLLRFLNGEDPFVIETSEDKFVRKLYDEIKSSEHNSEEIIIQLANMIYDRG